MSEESRRLAAARAGDEAAWEALVKDSLPRVLGLARKMLRHDTEAWDAAQEAYLRAWTRLGEFEERSAFATWVCGIVARLCLDRLRSRRTRPEDGEESLPPASARPSVEETVVNRALGAALAAAVTALPPPERTVFCLHEEAGMKYQEIAGQVGIPIGTVMSRLHAARQRLRQALAPWWKEQGR